MRRALRIVAIALGGVALLAALVAWRLSHGAITLDRLAPYLGAALTARGKGGRVDVGGAALVWDAVAHRPEVEATRVRVVGRNGETLATLPVLHVAFSLPALLRGEIVPTRVTLQRPRLRVAIQPDGRLAIGVATGRSATDDGDLTVAAAAWPPALAVHVSDAEIVLVDQLSEETARAAGVDLDFAADAAGMSIRLAGDVVLDGHVVPVRLGARYASDLTQGDVTLAFRRLDPAVLGVVFWRLAARHDARWLPDLAEGLSRVRMPLDGRVRAALDGAFRPAGGRVRVRGASGTLSLPEVHPDEIAVTRLGLVAQSRLAAGLLEIRTLALDIDGARLHVVGHAQGNAIDMRATVKHLATEGLARYWPPQLGGEARRWVTTNISSGQIRSGDAHVVGTLALHPSVRFVPGAINGSFVFDGLAVRYQASMPPATGVAGTGSFDDKRWNLRAARGAVGRLELVHARATISGAGRDAPLAEVKAGLRGPLAEALVLLRRAPLDQVTPPEIDSESVSGTGVAELFVRVPSTRRPPELKVSARMDDVAIPRIFHGRSLSEGAFTLDVDARELRLEGDGRLEGVPLALVWTEERGSGRQRRVVDVRGRIDAAGRAALGFDLSPWVAGPIEVKARYEGDPAQSATVDVHADLEDAVLAVPVSALAKDAGTPGEARARLELRGGSVRAVRESEVQVAGSRLSGHAIRSPDGASWREIEAEAKLVAPTPAGRAGACSLTMQPSQSGYRFRLASNDAGALLERLAFGANASGGKLVLAGTADFEAPGYPLDGRLDVRDLTVLQAPVLTRIATLASVTALRDALAGGGIRFRHVDAGIRHRDATVILTDGLASAPSLGITLRGTIDRNTGIADLAGSLIPSYTGLNTAPSRIPVIGTLVTGRDGAGIYAVDFTARGPLASPSVSVDPVSALTPSALRDLVRRLRW